MKEPKELLLPSFLSGVQAGFPSSADDYIEQKLDLNQLMVANPAATFFLRVEGDSMNGAGIQSGDLLVVDRSLKAYSGKIIVAILNGEFTVKRLLIQNEKMRLIAENPLYPNIEISEDIQFEVWGVVTYVIHRAN